MQENDRGTPFRRRGGKEVEAPLVMNKGDKCNFISLLQSSDRLSICFAILVSNPWFNGGNSVVREKKLAYLSNFKIPNWTFRASDQSSSPPSARSMDHCKGRVDLAKGTSGRGVLAELSCGLRKSLVSL
jgi:hypothetical protein